MLRRESHDPARDFRCVLLRHGPPRPDRVPVVKVLFGAGYLVAKRGEVRDGVFGVHPLGPLGDAHGFRDCLAGLLDVLRVGVCALFDPSIGEYVEQFADAVLEAFHGARGGLKTRGTNGRLSHGFRLP